MLGDLLRREGRDWQAHNVLVATVHMLVLKLTQDVVALLQALLLEVCLGLGCDLITDETNHVDVIG